MNLTREVFSQTCRTRILGESTRACYCRCTARSGDRRENSLFAFIRQSFWRRNADIHIEACSHSCHPYQPLYSYSPEFRQHKFESFACEFCTRNHNKAWSSSGRQLHYEEWAWGSGRKAHLLSCYPQLGPRVWLAQLWASPGCGTASRARAYLTECAWHFCSSYVITQAVALERQWHCSRVLSALGDGSCQGSRLSCSFLLHLGRFQSSCLKLFG